MESQGYVKIFRKLKNKAYYKKSKYLHLWIHLLLSANHKEKEFLWNDKAIELKAGQFITGRTKLSKNTGISGTTIERILKMLENEHQIGQQKTNKFRIITIKNWDKYQSNNKKRTAKRTSNGQQTDTNNNDKNEKKDKSESALVSPVFSYWQKKVEALTGKPPIINFAKDGNVSKKAIKVIGLEDAKKIIDYYLKSEKIKEYGYNLSVALSVDTIGKWQYHNQSNDYPAV